MKWFGLATLFGCNTDAPQNSGSLVSGPFEICWQVKTSRSGLWFNNGGDRNAKVYTSWFSVKYHGKQVEIPGYNAYAGTNMESPPQPEPVGYFWQALFLKDSPQPAVLVGVHSMHLLTEENSQLKIIPLHEQGGDFATYQWLDSQNGQPGPMNNVYLGDDSHSTRFLEGGRYLMVNSHVVLDVHTLQVYPFDLITYEVLQKLDGYHAGNASIVQFSPKRNQIVLVGNRSNPENRLLYQYGLVVIDFKKNLAYSVPFDRTNTRFFSIWDATPDWLNTYFEWALDKAGEERIALRHFNRLPYWKGRWNYLEETGEVDTYTLMPVQNTMLPALMDFIRHETTVLEIKTEETHHYDVGSADSPSCNLVTNMVRTPEAVLYVYLNPIDQSIALYGENKALIRKIGQQFDQELSQGKYQEYFGRYE